MQFLTSKRLTVCHRLLARTKPFGGQTSVFRDFGSVISRGRRGRGQGIDHAMSLGREGKDGEEGSQPVMLYGQCSVACACSERCSIFALFHEFSLSTRSQRDGNGNRGMRIKRSFDALFCAAGGGRKTPPPTCQPPSKLQSPLFAPHRLGYRDRLPKIWVRSLFNRAERRLREKN